MDRPYSHVPMNGEQLGLDHQDPELVGRNQSWGQGTRPIRLGPKPAVLLHYHASMHPVA